jgi:hypothetical protein
MEFLLKPKNVDSLKRSRIYNTSNVQEFEKEKGI